MGKLKIIISPPNPGPPQNPDSMRFDGRPVRMAGEAELVAAIEAGLSGGRAVR